MARRRKARAPVAAAIAFGWLGALCGAASAEDPNPVPSVPKGDPAMRAAFARAAATLDDFLDKWRNPPRGAERFVVKIGVMDAPGSPGYVVARPGASGPVEWFWAGDLRAEDNGYSARLSNDPERLHNVAYGQLIHFTRQDIGDWMYQRNGKIVGNATACPALAYASAQERRQMKEQYGIDCD